jgi:hypothetical protein
MLRLISGLLLVFAIIAVTARASWAVFSQTQNLTGNTIATGKLEFDLREFSGNKPIGTIPSTSTNMVPGQWTDWGRLVVFNHSDSVKARVWMYVDNVTGAACDKVNLKVTTGFAGGNEYANQLYMGPLNNIIGVTHAFETTQIPPFNVLNPNTSQAIHQTAQLDDSADNNYQSKSCSWTEYFYAENVPAPVPSPAP